MKAKNFTLLAITILFSFVLANIVENILSAHLIKGVEFDLSENPDQLYEKIIKDNLIKVIIFSLIADIIKYIPPGYVVGKVTAKDNLYPGVVLGIFLGTLTLLVYVLSGYPLNSFTLICIMIFKILCALLFCVVGNFIVIRKTR